MIAEAIYENRLKPFTFSAGVDWNWKYMSNVYSGDAQSENAIHSSGIYGFVQVKGKVAKLSYVAGMGLSNRRYRQGTNRYSFWLARPKVTLAYSLSDAWQLRYDFELSQHVSQVAMISDVRIRQNSMEWKVGNPSLKPNSKYEQSLTSVTRFFNKGDDYNHCYTGYCYGGGLRGYWGKWSVALYADNGWHFMEGENIGHQAARIQGSVGCRLGNFDGIIVLLEWSFLARESAQDARSWLRFCVT